jgi:hypothetical protein
MLSTGLWSGFVADRLVVDVSAPPGGWGMPWPNVAEIEALLPHETWTLVGGLMTQLHGIRHGVHDLRPTNDVDIVLHVETTRGVAARAADALESLGYRLAPPIDDRTRTAHRFRRGDSAVDLVTSAQDVVDVLVAEHAPPRVAERLGGRTMVAIEGGTQALRRTMEARLAITPGRSTTVSVPAPFGAAGGDRRPLCPAGAVRRFGPVAPAGARQGTSGRRSRVAGARRGPADRRTGRTADPHRLTPAVP